MMLLTCGGGGDEAGDGEAGAQGAQGEGEHLVVVPGHECDHVADAEPHGAPALGRVHGLHQQLPERHLGAIVAVNLRQYSNTAIQGAGRACRAPDGERVGNRVAQNLSGWPIPVHAGGYAAGLHFTGNGVEPLPQRWAG